jgi:hypothetical protein
VATCSRRQGRTTPTSPARTSTWGQGPKNDSGSKEASQETAGEVATCCAAPGGGGCAGWGDRVVTTWPGVDQRDVAVLADHGVTVSADLWADLPVIVPPVQTARVGLSRLSPQCVPDHHIHWGADLPLSPLLSSCCGLCDLCYPPCPSSTFLAVGLTLTSLGAPFIFTLYAVHNVFLRLPTWSRV